MTLPTNAAINTAFRIAPYLANGDTGIRAITNISTSAGSAGVLTIYGLLTINATTSTSIANFGNLSPLESPTPAFLWEAGERIGFYRYGATTASHLFGHLTAVAET
jgi:hypothetical protein